MGIESMQTELEKADRPPARLTTELDRSVVFKSKRRRTPPRIFLPRFSIRLLLISTALIALAFSFYQRLESYRRIVLDVEMAGGGVDYFEKNPDSIGTFESWLRQRFPQSYFDEIWSAGFGSSRQDLDRALTALTRAGSIEQLDLCFTAVTDDGLAPVVRMTSLKSLNLRYTGIGDAGLRQIVELPALEVLYLNHTPITRVGLELLPKFKNLKKIDLAGLPLEDSDLDHLLPLSQLERLGLAHTRVTEEGIDKLGMATSLKILDLEGLPVSDAELEHLLTLPNLEYLGLKDTLISDAGLKQIHVLRTLKEVNLSGTNTSAEAKAELQRRLPQCRVKQ